MSDYDIIRHLVRISEIEMMWKDSGLRGRGGESQVVTLQCCNNYYFVQEDATGRLPDLLYEPKGDLKTHSNQIQNVHRI